jgi:S-DNA-T family DNA segregation ATPase FtsK/SpoIIIE
MDDEQPRPELATVHRLPIVPADTEVLEGEEVSEEEYQRLTSQRERARARYSGYRQDVVVVVDRTRSLVRHHRTKAAFRHTVVYPLAGARVVAGRWRDAHGTNRYERMMRAAEAAGDHDKLLEWESRDVAEKERRHKRTMAWLDTPGKLFKAAAIGLAGLIGLLLVLGVVMAIDTGRIGDVTGPIAAVFDAVAFVVWFLVTYGMALTIGATVAGFAYLYTQGRSHGDMPDWLMSPAEVASTKDPVPDEGTIINALKHLGISAFNKALRSGWRIRFITSPVEAANRTAWWTQLELPMEVPVSEVVKRTEKLAHNLVRYTREVWPTEAEGQPGVLDLFVLNKGALSKPVEPWPLLSNLDTARVDYFSGVPVAVTLRGDVVLGGLYEANYFFGGRPGSGKSTMTITLCCGAMLDPLVDIDIVVMAFNADYDAMEPRLRSLNTGPPDEMVEPAMALLRGAFADLDTRGQALREHGKQYITRELAEQDSRLHPRVLVIDECQHLFLSDTYGPTAIKMALKLITTSRKYGVTSIFLTPEPTNDACPRQIITNVSNKACFPIGDQMGNDAILGTGSHKAGYTAVGLEPKTVQSDGTVLLGDIGTCMARGFTPIPQLMRSFRNDKATVERITARAMELRAGVQQATPAEKPVPVDHLADILLVLGAQPRMRTEEVMSALVARNPLAYRPWSHGDLKACLLPWKAEPYKTGGFMQVNAERVREAIARRDSGEEPEPDES